MHHICISFTAESLMVFNTVKSLFFYFLQFLLTTGFFPVLFCFQDRSCPFVCSVCLPDHLTLWVFWWIQTVWRLWSLAVWVRSTLELWLQDFFHHTTSDPVVISLTVSELCSEATHTHTHTHYKRVSSNDMADVAYLVANWGMWFIGCVAIWSKVWFKPLFKL